jgi:hypothetical protein
MRPEIEAYLREHGGRYTTEALRRQLIHAGYDPNEIDVALRETEVARGPQLAETRTSRTRFWWSAVGLHLGALVLVTVWLVTRRYTYAPIAAPILGLMLLVGLGISGLIGRRLLRSSGLAVALVIPLISVIGLSGWCLAAMGGTPVQIPATPGTMQLQIDPPLSFEASGPAECFLQKGGFSVHAADLGDLDTRYVSAQVFSLGDPNAQASPTDSFRAVSLSISLFPRSGIAGETYYGSPGDVPLELDAISDGRSGTLKFEGLAGQLIEDPQSSPGVSPEPISGTLSWTCE